MSQVVFVFYEGSTKGVFVSSGFWREEKGLKSNYESILLFKRFPSLSSPPKPQLTNTPLE